MGLFSEIFDGAKKEKKMLDGLSASVKLISPDGNVTLSTKETTAEVGGDTPEAFAEAFRKSEKVKVGQKVKFENSTGTRSFGVAGDYASQTFLKHENGE